MCIIWRQPNVSEAYMAINNVEGVVFSVVTMCIIWRQPNVSEAYMAINTVEG
jgi:hypothetical protein